MIHGIMKFTLSIAFRYVLHRNKSRDIDFRESFPRITEKSATTLNRGTLHNKCKAKGQKEEKCMRERETKVSNPLTGGGSNRGQSPPAPRPRKDGGNAWNSDREGLGWPPQELALLLVLPQHQPTTIPPFLHKAMDPERKKRVENKVKVIEIKRGYRLKPPKPRAFAKGGELKEMTIEKD